MKTYLFIIILLLGFTSCNDRSLETELNTERVSVQFKLSPDTRATDHYFEDGDEIGIYVVQSGKGIAQLQDNGNFADNKRFIVRNGQIEPYSESDRIMIDPSASYDYYCYYPYQNVFIPLNQTIYQSTYQSDIQYYKKGDVKYAISRNIQGETVYLSFKHVFALLEVHLTRQSAFEIQSLYVKDAYYAGTFNLSNGDLKTSEVENIRHDISMNLYQKSGNDYIFRALLPAQTFSNDQSLVMMEYVNNTTSWHKNQSDLSLVTGEKAVFRIREKFDVTAYSQTDSCRAYSPQTKYWCGTEAIVYAQPGINYQFVGWYAAPNFSNIVSTEMEYRFIVDKSYNLGAKFRKKTEKLRIVKTSDDLGDGGIVEGEGDNIERFQDWTVVATPNYDAGYGFVGWFENGELKTISRTYEFKMPPHILVLEARFIRERYYLTLKVTGTTFGNAVFLSNGGGFYSDKELWWYKTETCTVEARNIFGNVKFVGWYENNSLLSTQIRYTFNVTKDRNIEARFQ